MHNAGAEKLETLKDDISLSICNAPSLVKTFTCFVGDLNSQLYQVPLISTNKCGEEHNSRPNIFIFLTLRQII